MKCSVCGHMMMPLFTGHFCPNDCDKKTVTQMADGTLWAVDVRAETRHRNFVIGVSSRAAARLLTLKDRFASKILSYDIAEDFSGNDSLFDRRAKKLVGIIHIFMVEKANLEMDKYPGLRDKE